jgi:hypothetical protein
VPTLELEISCLEIAKGGFLFSVLQNFISFLSEIVDNVALHAAGALQEVLESIKRNLFVLKYFTLYTKDF